jgi:hypothetical protein
VMEFNGFMSYPDDEKVWFTRLGSP